MTIEEDPILGPFFNTPEKKARWIARLKLAYLLWILLVILVFCFFVLWYIIY